MIVLIHTIHWVVYIGSTLSVIALFTRVRHWAAVWLGVLFASQAVFSGCLLTVWENKYRIQEGLAPLQNGLLTDRISSTYGALLSALIALVYLIIFSLEHYDKKT